MRQVQMLPRLSYDITACKYVCYVWYIISQSIPTSSNLQEGFGKTLCIPVYYEMNGILHSGQNKIKELRLLSLVSTFLNLT